MIEFLEYKKTPPEVAGLRQITNEWRKTAGFWTFDQTLEALSRSGALLVYGRDPAAADETWPVTVLCDLGPYSVDLLYIYVRAEARRKGLAREAMLWLRRRLQQSPSLEALHLEVRLGNEAAKNLYRSLGMEEVGSRKKYYADGEDALTYKWVIQDPC